MPEKRLIPYARQSINDDDVRAVTEALRSDWLTQGPAVELFEKRVAEYCGTRYAVAVNSGTSALHLACLAADLSPGGLLWTSPNTFLASANCARYCGADVDFVDIDPATYNMDVSELERKLRLADSAGRLPHVLVPVHFAGQSCGMVRISELAKDYRITTIEDATHAIGGRYRDAVIGSCTFSDMTVLSFHAVKIITTCEGGMILTNREDLYERLACLRSHGTTRDPASMEGESHGAWYYQQVDLGFNYRMTDIQAALGTNQLNRLDAFVTRRHQLADRYHRGLKDLPVVLPWQDPDNHSAFHLYVIRLKTDEVAMSRRQVFDQLRDRGILVNVHYIPVHTQPYYRALGFKDGDFPQAEEYYQGAITLPLYPEMRDEDQAYVIDALRGILT